MTDHRVGEDDVTGLRAMAEATTHNQITYQVKSARPTFVEIGYGFVEGIEFTATNDQGQTHGSDKDRGSQCWCVRYAVREVRRKSDSTLLFFGRTLNDQSASIIDPMKKWSFAK